MYVLGKMCFSVRVHVWLSLTRVKIGGQPPCGKANSFQTHCNQSEAIMVLGLRPRALSFADLLPTSKVTISKSVRDHYEFLLKAPVAVFSSVTVA